MNEQEFLSKCKMLVTDYTTKHLDPADKLSFDDGGLLNQ